MRLLKGLDPSTRRDKIRTLIAADRMFGEAIARWLQSDTDTDVVAEVATVKEALAGVSANVNVVLVDTDISGNDGVEAIRTLMESNANVHVVILSSVPDSHLLARAVESGISGYVSKTQTVDELISAIKRAAAGEIVMPADQLAEVFALVRDDARERVEAHRRFTALTPRESEILEALAAGESTSHVADALFISPLTVQSHINSILSKIGAHSRLQAVALALHHGVIRLHEL